jgi:hypothetical protein
VWGILGGVRNGTAVSPEMSRNAWGSNEATSISIDADDARQGFAKNSEMSRRCCRRNGQRAQLQCGTVAPTDLDRKGGRVSRNRHDDCNTAAMADPSAMAPQMDILIVPSSTIRFGDADGVKQRRTGGASIKR